MLGHLPEKIQRAIQLRAQGRSYKELQSEFGYTERHWTNLLGESGRYKNELADYKAFLANKNVAEDGKRIKTNHDRAQELMDDLYALAKNTGDPTLKLKAIEQFLDRQPGFSKINKTEGKLDQVITQAKEIVWRRPEKIHDA